MIKPYFLFDENEDVTNIIDEINSSQKSAKLNADYCSRQHLKNGKLAIISDTVTKLFITDRDEVMIDIIDFLD
jgi:hypothetical protein